MIATQPRKRTTARIEAEPHSEALAQARPVIVADGLAAVPTETVYGLAANAASGHAVDNLYAAKGRPSSNPLIVHVADRGDARAIAAAWPEAAERLAAAFWPGPLTLVLPVRAGAVAPAALAGGRTVALRMPDAALMRDLAGTVGPLVAPSANRSGRVSATTADAVLAELDGLIDLVVDAGPSPIGVESTVVDVTGPAKLLRPGAIAPQRIEATLAHALAERGPQAGPLRSPGLLSSHYAPRAALRLDVAPAEVGTDEGFLAFGPSATAAAPSARTVSLSSNGDLSEAARNLYAALRTLDATGVASIAVSPIPAEGLGLAILDRLARAAAPRTTESP